MFREIALAASLAGISSCGDVTNDTRTDPSTTLDEHVFRCNVEPILAKQCSYNACHGVAGANRQGAALRVYTPGKLRATPPATLDEGIMPLTTAERHDNFLSAAGFASGVAPDDNFLLRKPLPSSWGGFEHNGGAIFPSPMDAQYTTIRAWLAGTGTPMTGCM
jgi:hypothetical protein